MGNLTLAVFDLLSISKTSPQFCPQDKQVFLCPKIWHTTRPGKRHANGNNI